MKHLHPHFAALVLTGLALVTVGSPAKAQSNGGGNGASAQDLMQYQPAAPGMTVSNYDKTFLTRAASDEMFELEMSRVAMEKASAPDLKAYAIAMVNQHLAVYQELSALAQSKGVSLPTRLGTLRQRELFNLRKLSGEDFDRAYFQRIAMWAHRQDVRLFRDAGRMSPDADVRAWANKMMPAQEQHVADARALPSAPRLSLTPFDPNSFQGGM